MLRASEMILGRADLRLNSASVTYCLPVPCGPVTIDVEILRDGRRGAQVLATLRTDPDHSGPPNAVATSVFTLPADDALTLDGLTFPAAFAEVPDDEPLPAIGDMAFLRQTEWRPTTAQPADALHRTAWFRFAQSPVLPDGTWEPSTLAVPGDAIGVAVVPDDSTAGDMFLVSLQISMQLHRPARGTWLGIDSVGFAAAGGTASGLVSLWTATGDLVATITQTALIRHV